MTKKRRKERRSGRDFLELLRNRNAWLGLALMSDKVLVARSRDLASGITTAIGSRVVSEGADVRPLHFDRLGWLAIAVSIGSLRNFRLVKSAD